MGGLRAAGMLVVVRFGARRVVMGPGVGVWALLTMKNEQKNSL